MEALSPNDVVEAGESYRVLVVEDEPGQRFLQKEILSTANIDVEEAGDGRSALCLIEEQFFDVILLDWELPGLDGEKVCQRIRQNPHYQFLPVIMISGVAGIEQIIKCFHAGATDFIRKPFLPKELIARITAAAKQNRILKRLESAEKFYFSVARMVEARDWHTGQHCIRLAHNSERFGKFLGLDEYQRRLLYSLGYLHDIGKLAIPDRILLKGETLTPKERSVMEQHTIIGANLCSNVESLHALVPLIRHHHERWDGSGYPDGLEGERIPYLSRVFQMVDIYDALASDRPYRRPLPQDEIIAHFEDEARANRLDPELTRCFIRFVKSHKKEMMLPDADPKASAPFPVIRKYYKYIQRNRDEQRQKKIIPQKISDNKIMQWPALIGFHAAVLESLDVAIFVIDAKDRITYANPACCSILEMPLYRMIGVHFREVFQPTAIDGSEHNIKRCPIYRCIVSAHPTGGEAIFNTYKGKQVPVELHCSPMGKRRRERRGIVVAFRDITERRKMQNRQRLAAAVFDNTHEGIVVTDAKCNIIEVNDAFTRITGYEKREVIGKKPDILSSGRHNANFYKKMWASIEERGKWQGEIIDRTRDGEVFPAWLTVNHVTNEGGEVINYIGIFSDITSLKRSQEQIIHLAYHDPLTGLPNRLLLQDRLKVAVRQARREGHSVALIFLDLDRFKDINDSLGHIVGDQLLTQIAKRIRDNVRAGDTVARIGGDEFVVIINSVRSQREVEQAAQNILNSMSEPLSLADQEFVLGASLGISLYPQDSKDENELLRHADSAMYHAKEEGLKKYHFYSEEMSARAEHRLAMQSALRIALEEEQFVLEYQPQFDLITGRLVGIEALIRWHRPGQPPIPPSEFIPYAEDGGLIEQLGEWVLRKACQQASDWYSKGVLPSHVAVNVSAIQVHRSNLLEKVINTLEDTGLPAERLELEITESTLMLNNGPGIHYLEALRSSGVHIAIDDFGTGYSSLSYLKRLPVDTIKIDREFVRYIPKDANSRAIVSSIVALARGLGMDVIAEGVETDAQRLFLTGIGCKYGQGWLYSKSLDPKTLADRYLDTKEPHD